VALYFAVALPLAFALNVWKDDAYTLHTTASGTAYAFHQAVTFEQNAPLYYVLLTLWRHVNESAVWARLFSVFCIGAVIAMLPALVRRYAPGAPAPWIALLMALSPALIWSALEIRIFALVILLSALLLLAFYDAFLETRGSTRAAVAYALLCVASAYTQYYLVFLIAGQAVALALYRPERFGRYAIAALPLTASLLPLLQIVHAETSNVTGQYRPPGIVDSVHMLARALSQYVIPASALPRRSVGYAIAFCAALPAFAALARARESRQTPVIIAMFAAACVIFAAATFAAGAWIGIRHPSGLLLPAMLSIFAGLALVRPPVRSRVTMVWIAVLICMQIAALFTTYRGLAKEGDWIRVAAFLQAHERASEPVFVFEAEDTLPLEYYYRGINRIAGVPRDINFKHFDLREFQLQTGDQAARAFAEVQNSGRVWLVTSGACGAYGVDYGCDVMERYVRSCCRIVSTTRFYESTVRLLVMRSGKHRSLARRN
jgi:uncharacterized membrane protein